MFIIVFIFYNSNTISNIKYYWTNLFIINTSAINTKNSSTLYIYFLLYLHNRFTRNKSITKTLVDRTKYRN